MSSSVNVQKQATDNVQKNSIDQKLIVQKLREQKQQSKVTQQQANKQEQQQKVTTVTPPVQVEDAALKQQIIKQKVKEFVESKKNPPVLQIQSKVLLMTGLKTFALPSTAKSAKKEPESPQKIQPPKKARSQPHFFLTRAQKAEEEAKKPLIAEKEVYFWGLRNQRPLSASQKTEIIVSLLEKDKDGGSNAARDQQLQALREAHAQLHGHQRLLHEEPFFRLACTGCQSIVKERHRSLSASSLKERSQQTRRRSHSATRQNSNQEVAQQLNSKLKAKRDEIVAEVRAREAEYLQRVRKKVALVKDEYGFLHFRRVLPTIANAKRNKTNAEQSPQPKSKNSDGIVNQKGSEIKKKPIHKKKPEVLINRTSTPPKTIKDVNSLYLESFTLTGPGEYEPHQDERQRPPKYSFGYHRPSKNFKKRKDHSPPLYYPTYDRLSPKSHLKSTATTMPKALRPEIVTKDQKKFPAADKYQINEIAADPFSKKSHRKPNTPAAGKAQRQPLYAHPTSFGYE